MKEKLTFLQKPVRSGHELRLTAPADELQSSIAPTDWCDDFDRLPEPWHRPRFPAPLCAALLRRFGLRSFHRERLVRPATIEYLGTIRDLDIAEADRGAARTGTPPPALARRSEKPTAAEAGRR